MNEFERAQKLDDLRELYRHWGEAKLLLGDAEWQIKKSTRELWPDGGNND